MPRRGERRDHTERAKALAKAIHAGIDEYNLRFPNNPYAIDDATSRILENDPDYHPPRKRAENKQRHPTLNPGIFTVLAIAIRLEATVGKFLGERGFDITKSDLRSLRWIADYIRMRFPIDDVSPLPDERRFVEKEFTLPRAPEATKLESKGQIAAGRAPIESDFEITEAVILGTVKGASLVAAQVKGRSMSDRIRDGDLIVIDTARTTPRQSDPVAVYVENEGGVLGYWRAEAGAYYLDKHNPDFSAYKLGDPAEWRVLGVITTVQSAITRQDRPTSVAKRS
jgi:SOS-response transcriptional repressor LexA